MILIGQYDLVLRPPRRHRAETLRPLLRALAVVGVFRQGEDQAAQPADARARAHPRRRGRARRQPSDPVASGKPGAGRAFAPAGRRARPAPCAQGRGPRHRPRRTRASACSTSMCSTRKSRRSGSSAAARKSPARSRCWKRTAPSGRPNTGSATASCTPISQSPAPSATRRRRCRTWSRCRTIPELRAHCERLEALPVFREISQPFIPPA